MPDLVPTARPVTRRTAAGVLAVTGLLATSALSGCEVGDVLPGKGGGPAGPGPAPGVDPAAEADAALVARVVADVVASRSLVVVARTRHRVLRDLLAPLEAAHDAHLAALDGTAEAGSGAGVVGGAGAVLGRVRQQELRLQRRLTDAAVAAASGELAQLLASASASIAQHVAVLPRTLPREVVA